MNGTLYGVGVGPGDPRLMTYLAVDTIKCCPVLAVPADGKGKAVAYRIASGIVKNLDQKECLDLTTPMTKDLVRKGLGVSILPQSACAREQKKGKMAVLPIENL